MRGMKQWRGRRVLVTTKDGGAIEGLLVATKRDGIEVTDAVERVREVPISGTVWIPAAQVAQVQADRGR